MLGRGTGYNPDMKHSPELTGILNRLRDLLPLIKEKYRVETLGVFGSYIRNEQKADSDIDILVTFSDPPGLLKYIELENFLSDELGIKVDLVMKEALKPNIGERILSEVHTV
jgi:predicted nucleotidyltransferase